MGTKQEQWDAEWVYLRDWNHWNFFEPWNCRLFWKHGIKWEKRGQAMTVPPCWSYLLIMWGNLHEQVRESEECSVHRSESCVRHLCCCCFFLSGLLPCLIFCSRPPLPGQPSAACFTPPPFSSFLPDFSPATLAWLWVSVARLDRFCINKAAAKDFEWEHLCMFPWTWMGSNQNNVTIIRNDR